LRAGPRFSRRQVAIAGAALATVAAAGAVAWPHVFPAPTTGRILVTVVPKNATLIVDGQRIPTMPDGSASIAAAEIGRTYQLIARLDGFEPNRAVIVPHRGDNEIALELQAVATVVLDSSPPGSTIEIDGALMGTTPLTVTTLAPGTTVTLVFKQPGFRPATTRLRVPQRGQLSGTVQTLEPSPQAVRVRFRSNPPGAAITPTGKPPTADRTYTPADIYVEANQEQRFTLSMPDHQPLVLEPFTARPGARGVEKGGDLRPLSVPASPTKGSAPQP
jgi:hypothetical protein